MDALSLITIRPIAPSGPLVDVDQLSHIAAVLASGRHIMVGTIKPISGAAVAHDGRKTLAMLRRQPTEAIADLLLRLNAAIVTAKSDGKRIDAINKPSSDVRYEL
jgi:hypothetical protein